jgi:hypothetical protein
VCWRATGHYWLASLILIACRKSSNLALLSDFTCVSHANCSFTMIFCCQTVIAKQAILSALLWVRHSREGEVLMSLQRLRGLDE